ncbi:tigger transposable element-derived protein 1 [Trichonephila clavipes]|nr:tigger transposable element-derived protein 1 [Trichonephila clavipes]
MKALKFYKELKESEPSTSSRESEVASADEEAARKYPEKLAKIIKDGEYCAHQVFNADETGLFWKNANPYLHCKVRKTASGFKAAKDRVTLLLCSNASGDRMLKKPLLVNRSLKPRALKGKT